MGTKLIIEGHQEGILDHFLHLLTELDLNEDDHDTPIRGRSDWDSYYDVIHCMWNDYPSAMEGVDEEVVSCIRAFWRQFEGTLLEDLRDTYQPKYQVVDFLVSTRDHYQLFLSIGD